MPYENPHEPAPNWLPLLNLDRSRQIFRRWAHPCHEETWFQDLRTLSARICLEGQPSFASILGEGQLKKPYAGLI